MRQALVTCLVLASLLAITLTGKARDETDSSGAELSTIEAVRDLVRQQSALLAEAERMRERIDKLVRAVREQGSELPHTRAELGELLAALDSDDYQARVRATGALRRELVDRLWLLIETPDLKPEAQQRVKELLNEASAMIGLTNIAVDLEPVHRDMLWTLLDDEPDWVLAALGDEPDRIRQALRNSPPGHELAVEIVLAAIVRNEMRPVARQIAVSEIHDPSSRLLRDAMLDLLKPDSPSNDPVARTFDGYREKAAVEALRVLARRPTRELVVRILTTLQGAQRWNARLDLFLVQTLLDIGATEAIGPLHEIARDKRRHLRGSYRAEGVEMQPGDPELIAAAVLLGLDVEELEILESEPRNDREPRFRGFAPPPTRPEAPQRSAAYAAVGEAVERSGPYPPIPELERLRRAQDKNR